MKTQKFGVSQYTTHHSLVHRYVDRLSARNGDDWPPALENYKENRENGQEQDNPGDSFPGDGRYTWVEAGEDEDGDQYYHARYDEGPKDKAWMEEKDANYVARLAREKKDAAAKEAKAEQKRLAEVKRAKKERDAEIAHQKAQRKAEIARQKAEQKQQLQQEGKVAALTTYHHDKDIGDIADSPEKLFPESGDYILDDPDNEECFNYTYVESSNDKAWYDEKATNYAERLRLALITATKNNNLDHVSQLLKTGSSDIHETDSDGMTALHHAAESGYVAIVKLLLANGADATLVENNDLTPLEIIEDIAESKRSRGHAGCIKNIRMALNKSLSSELSSTASSQSASDDELTTSLDTSTDSHTSTQIDTANASGTSSQLTSSLSVSSSTSGHSESIPFKTVSHEALQLTDKLGSGGFGDVYRGYYNFSEVAIKQLHLTSLSTHAKKEFENELNIMANLVSPRIVRLLAACVEPGHYSLVMELMSKLSLFDVLQNTPDLAWSTRWQIAMDIASGLAYLHQENIIHRDMKSLNVLLDGSMRAKLTDFGLSKIKTETASKTTIQPGHQAAGSLLWMAPELLSEFKSSPDEDSDSDSDDEDIQASHTPKSDVYSTGVVFWEVASGKIPYAGKKPGKIPVLIANGKKLKTPKDCPEEFKQIFKACWNMDPDERPSSSQLVNQLRSLGDLFKPLSDTVSTTSTLPAIVQTAHNVSTFTSQKPHDIAEQLAKQIEQLVSGVRINNDTEEEELEVRFKKSTTDIDRQALQDTFKKLFGESNCAVEKKGVSVEWSCFNNSHAKDFIATFCQAKQALLNEHDNANEQVAEMKTEFNQMMAYLLSMKGHVRDLVNAGEGEAYADEEGSGEFSTFTSH